MFRKTSQVFLTAIAVLAMSAAMTQAAVTTITGATGGNDSWNTASNWSAGVPIGAVDAAIAANVTAKVENAATPTYTGNLTLNANSTLQLAFTTNYAQDINALGTLGSTTIYMNSGSLLNLRTSQPASYSIPAIQLLGDATVRIGESTQGGSGRTLAGGITGTSTLTFQGSGGKTAYLTTANSFGALVTGYNAYCYNGWTIRADATGSLGGDVTVNAYSDGTSTALLVINATDAMKDTAKLTLNGSTTTKLTMNYNDTVGSLVVAGVPQPAGTYTSTSGWISGTGTLTVTPPKYWAAAGNPTPSGTWSSLDANWNAAADGSGAASGWTSNDLSAGQTAVFAAGTGATGAYTVTVDGTQTFAGMIFEEGTVKLTGGTALQMIADCGVKVAAGLTATIETPITQDGTNRQLLKTGEGTLVLSGANTYAGATSVVGGTLRLGASNVLPDTSAVTVSSNTPGATATLDLNGYDDTIGSLTLGAVLTTSGASVTTGAGTLTLGGNVTYSATNNPLGATISGKLDLGGADRTFTVNDSLTAAYDLTVSAAISGAGVGLTKAGAGTLLLSSANTYTGTTTVSTGTLALSGAGTLGGGSANLTLSGGTVDLGGTTDRTVGTVSVTAAATGNVIQNGSLTGLVNTDYAASNTTGIALIPASLLASGTAGFTKSGAGTAILSGANTYAGNTTISGGTLQFNSAGAIGGSGRSVTVGANTLAAGYAIDNSFLQRINNTVPPTGTIALAADSSNNLDFSSDITGANLTGAYLGAANTGASYLTPTYATFTYSGTLTPNGTTYRLGGGGGTLVMSGTNAITGTGYSLVVNGNVVLPASNNYDTGTTLTSGTLTINNAGALGSGTLTINGGALNNSSGADIALSTNNMQTWGGNFTYNGAYGPKNNSTTFAGPGNLDLGTGAVTMNAARTVTVNNLTLTVGGSITGTGSLDALDIVKAGSGTLLLAAPVALRTGQTATVNAGIEQVDGQLTGGFGFTKAGAGTLYLNNASNNFGASPGPSTITVSDGLLQVASNGGLGNSANIVSITANSATKGLRLTGGTAASPASYTLTSRTINLGAAASGIDVMDYTTATLDTAFTTSAASNTLQKNANGVLAFASGVNNTGLTGTWTISGGAIQMNGVNNLNASGSALTVSNAVGSALQLNSGVTFNKSGTFTINGSGLNGAGSLQSMGTSANSVSSLITLGSAAYIGADDGSTLNLTGSVSGAFGLTFNAAGTGAINVNTSALNANITGLTKYGTGTLTLGVTHSSFTAPIIVSGGTLAISTGVLGGTGLVSAYPGSTINLTSTSAHRLGGRPLTLGGATLNVSGGAAETTGTFTLNAGESVINNTSGATLTLGAAAPAFGTPSTRGPTALFKGGSPIVFGATPTVSNSGTNTDGVQTKGILPWAIFDSGIGNGSSFATVDVGGTTVRALAAGEGDNSLTTNYNAVLTSNPAATNSVTINSLTFHSGSDTVTVNPSQTLTVSSGGVLSTVSSAAITGGLLSLGNAYIFTPGTSTNSLTISSAVSGSTLTKAGAGTLVLGNANGAGGYTANSFTGGNHDGCFFINEGAVKLGAGNALYRMDNNDANGITINSGATLDLNGNMQLLGPLMSNNFNSNTMRSATSVAGGTITSTNTNQSGSIICITGNPSGNGLYAFSGTISGTNVGFARQGQAQAGQFLLGPNTYGGPTLVNGGGTAQTTGLILKDGGTLANTSSITLDCTSGAGALVIDNTGLVNNNDRVKDSAPIYMNTGRLLYYGRAQTASTEALGALNLQMGISSVGVNAGGTGVNSVDLTFDSLSRSATNAAAVSFNGGSFGIAGNNVRVKFNTATGLTSAMVNNIIPWMIVNGDFGCYIPYSTVGGITTGGIGNLGAVGFPSYDSTATSLVNVNQPTWNVNAGTETITGTVNLNSLRVTTGATNLLFTNATDTLNLTSGALLINGNVNTLGSVVDNGRITAGGTASSGTSDLSILSGTSNNNTNILNSRIIDNPNGARVRLVVNTRGDGARTLYMNNGSNSYTGGTVVNDPVTLQAASGIVFPNDATGNTGVVINGCTVSMTNIGQIGSGNVVTLNGATLSLFGDNTYAGLNINAVGAGSSITSGGLAGTLTLTGNITSTSDGAYGGSTIGTTYLALPSNANVNVSQATFNGQVINPLNADLTISAAITAGGFTKQGAGVLVLSASNPTTGAVAMQAGTMLLRAANSFGSMNITGGVVRADVQQSIGGTTSTVTLNGSTATLWMNIGTVGSSTNTLSVGASGGTLASYGGDRTLGMPVSLTGALTVDLRDPTNTGITRQVTINQAVTGSGSLVVAGNASGDTSKYLSLSNASNNYSGGTTLNSGGRILLQNAASLGSVNGTLTVNTGGYLDLNGQDLGVGKLTGTGGTIINNLTGAKTLTIGNNDATGGNFAGSISAGSQTLNLVKTGTGTQTLSGPNTYTGDTTVAQGALETTTIVGANSNTTVAAGASLTADSIVQNTLTIGAGATVTIRATTGAGSASAVPEPGTWALIGIGLLSLLAFRRRR